MRIIKSFSIVFFATFLIGYALVHSTPKQQISTASTKIPEAIPIPPIVLKFEQETVDDSEDNLEWTENYDAKFKIKMLRTGEFHADEVKAKSGEIWLGLFKNGDEFSLRSAKINVKRVHDDIVDGESNKNTGKDVSVEGKNQPILLLKNASFLKKRQIKTVFYGDEENSYEEMNINNATDKILGLNDISYNLFVKNNKAEKGEYLDETSKLVLSDGKTEQILYSQKMCDDCGWAIHWAGDLDGDGKLDLYLNLTNHYNVEHYRLFLSSQAEKGKLVKEVANFRIVGC